MAISNQTKPIIVAILGNAIIAIAKAIGFFFSGSSALLSETIHSIADVMNQALLLLGIKRGEKGASDIAAGGPMDTPALQPSACTVAVGARLCRVGRDQPQQRNEAP